MRSERVRARVAGLRRGVAVPLLLALGACWDGKPVVPLEFVTIKPGAFKMGAPLEELCREGHETQREVTLTYSFEIGVAEVTQFQFEERMGYNPSYNPDCGANCPVEYLNWHEAVAFCASMDADLGLPSCFECAGSGTQTRCKLGPGAQVPDCKGHRLPTDAEWEHAYRAGTTTAFYNGPITKCQGIDPNASKIGWYKGNSGNSSHPVKQLQPNAWGLYDMSGNVGEMCLDYWFPTPPSGKVKDPVQITDTLGNKEHVGRGGGWNHDPAVLRGSRRDAAAELSRHKTQGFRCVRTED